ncbi:hypothetical protein Peur_042091 [Populus x canadensis]
MVKFSKELEAQLIPEWKEAFVNYWQLKKQIKKIKLSQKSKQRQQVLDHEFGLSIFDPIRSLAKNISSKLFHSDTETEIIQARSKSMEDGDEEVLYQTELVQLFSEEDEIGVDTMRLRPHRLKVRGDSWNLGALASQVESASESNETSADSQIDEIIAALEREGINSATRKKTKKGKPKMAMRIGIPAAAPTRTITAVTSMLWEDLVNNPKKELGAGDFINRKKIQCAEKMIRGAFVEFYRGLGLLKTYRKMPCCCAYGTQNCILRLHMIILWCSYSSPLPNVYTKMYVARIWSSHVLFVVRLMDDVESIFTKHFANNDRKKAMKFLKPQQQKESHMVTFFVGLLTGCFVSLFSLYAILAHLAGIFKPNSERSYVETVYPVFSVFALLSFHLFMYGCNLFMWKGTRINYNFIFEFQPSTALKYRDAFLICTTFMTSVVAAMVIHLLLRASGFSPYHVDAIPGILLLISIFVLICPFDIFYRPTRYCFIRIIRNIVCSPFYKIPLLRHMGSTTCYFLAGSFKTHRYETCKSGRLYRELAYVISFLPYYWRAMQCARRWFDESDLNHLANMGKYVSAMVAAGARITYGRQENHLWFGIVLVTSVFSTVYQLYWDFVKDWGLLNSKSKNLWLRDNLILKNKSIYYMSIVLNIVLRVAWVETVMGFRFNMVESRMLDFLLASLEVIRRGHWNFYRLENEHLNNVGKFRAVKAVPLPFRETDSDG